MAIADAVITRAKPLATLQFWQPKMHALVNKGILLIPLALIALFAWRNPHGSMTFWAARPGLALLVLFPILLWPIWKRTATQRHIIAMGGKTGTGKRSAKQSIRPPKPLLQPYWRSFTQWVDIVFFNDARTWRIGYLIGAVIVLAVTLTCTIDPAVVLNEPRDPAALMPNVAIQLIVPLLYYAVIASRCHTIGKMRSEVVKTIYNVSAAAFKYPPPGSSVRRAGDDSPLMTPDCIQVHKWETLTVPHQFAIPTTKSTSATDEQVWAELGANLNQRVECSTEDGWHVTRDKRGRGCTVTPADYPRGVLWDGEQDPDPMTFLVGQNLDIPGEWLKVTFSVTSSHFLVTGGTGTGKSSFAEAIMGQAASKRMPWNRAVCWDCHIVDPKDAFHSRWKGRPNITSTSGIEESFNTDGDPISGIEAMAEHMALLEAELKRRQQWLKTNGNGAAKWSDVPEDVLAETGFRPCLIVSDEYLDHVRKAKGRSEQVERDNDARDEIVRITDDLHRKGRSLGMHMITVLQRANMGNIGSDVPSNAQGRIVMGNIDGSQYQSMFNTVDVPVLPAETFDTEKQDFVPIPGRGRLQPTSGGRIVRMQVLYFGKGNIETLDKWLPVGGSPTQIIEEDSEAASTAEGESAPGLSWVADDTTEEGAPQEAATSSTPAATPEPAASTPTVNDDSPPWVVDETPPAPSNQAPSLQEQRQAANTEVATEQAPTSPQPTPTPPRPTAATTPRTTDDPALAQARETLEAITKEIRELNNISPHEISDDQRDQLASLFEDRRKLLDRITKQQRRKTPTPAAQRQERGSQYKDHGVREIFG